MTCDGIIDCIFFSRQHSLMASFASSSTLDLLNFEYLNRKMAGKDTIEEEKLNEEYINRENQVKLSEFKSYILLFWLVIEYILKIFVNS